MSLQKIVLVLAFGLLLVAVGWTLDTWQFWCFLGLFWCAEQMGRILGKIEGIIEFLEMSEHEQNRIRRKLRQAMEEEPK